MFACAIAGFLANFFSSHAIVGSSGREYIHADDAEGEHVLGALGLFLADAEVLDGLDGHRGHRDLEDLEVIERAVL